MHLERTFDFVQTHTHTHTHTRIRFHHQSTPDSPIVSQCDPFPEKPDKHSHVYSPTVLVHDALAWQRCVCRPHSSRSLQSFPVPSYPDKQWHWYEPLVFVHTALPWQLCVPCRHSFTSRHSVPDPAKPGLHSQMIRAFSVSTYCVAVTCMKNLDAFVTSRHSVPNRHTRADIDNDMSLQCSSTLRCDDKYEYLGYIH